MWSGCAGGDIQIRPVVVEQSGGAGGGDDGERKVVADGTVAGGVVCVCVCVRGRKVVRRSRV